MEGDCSTVVQSNNYLQVYLVTVKSPRSEFHEAALLVEREVLDVDGAGTFVDSRRYPQDASVAVNHHVWLVRHFVFAVRAAHVTSPQNVAGNALGHACLCVRLSACLYCSCSNY